jgi:uncharacterized protein YjbI with pentapeptide repeats
MIVNNYTIEPYANLRGANLRGVNLRGVNMRNCFGNNQEIISLQTIRYDIVYTSRFMQIGCKNYTIRQWFELSDTEIEGMDNGALKWWNKHKEWIKMSIELNPAIDSGSYPLYID